VRVRVKEAALAAAEVAMNARTERFPVPFQWEDTP
jgi:hypothetical protein